MRLIPRQRLQQRHRRSRIAVTEAEIAADLHYPAATREPRRSTNLRRPGVR